jgi:molecular chaperone HscB
MKYFELFEIPVSLQVDTISLKKKLFELSKRYHPDYFANTEAQRQAESLEMSAELNRAWKTFQDPDSIIQYVPEQKGVLEKEEKYQLPPAFLAEVMEINELLMEDETGAQTGIREKVNDLQKHIYEPVKNIIENYQEEKTGEKELLQVKEYYFKKKYLDRIKKQLM